MTPASLAVVDMVGIRLHCHRNFVMANRISLTSGLEKKADGVGLLYS
jgi:hypothetical protein